MSQTQKYFQLLIALITWTAVLLQFYLMIENRVIDVGETIIRFFSYFTILSNILVAFTFTIIALNNNSKLNRFFSTTNVLSAVTVYIVIVGLVYNLILRQQWDPQGWQLVVDNLLHSFTPVVTLLYWFYFVPAGQLQWKNCLPWLLYPLVYLVYVLLRGSVSNFYPYPFINVTQLGYAKALTNAVGVTVAFIIVSLILIGINKARSEKTPVSR